MNALFDAAKKWTEYINFNPNNLPVYEILHAINIAPGIKLIGNLKNGWQPYVSVKMVWNIMDQTDFNANNVSLPEMSVKPYFQYGVGVQKRWGERFTGFGQVMLRNGGRTGVALSAGFRWAIGKNPSKKN